MDVLRFTSEWFWNPDFWLPVNFTWADIEPTENSRYPASRDIYTYPIVLAVALLLLKRHLLVPRAFLPLAAHYGLNCRTRRAPEEIEELEVVYRRFDGGRVPTLRKRRVAEKLKWKLQSVDRWLYQRAASTKLSKGEKFADTCFVATLHIVGFFYGCFVLRGRAWATDILQCWEGYPYHEVDPLLWGYYVFMAALFWSLALGQWLRPSNAKDQWAVYAHHLFTITLLCISWTLNLVRIGTLLLVLHEASDWLLLIAKLAHVVDHQWVSGVVFGLTMVTWFVTRLVLYPAWILYSAFFVAPTYMFMPSAYLFIFLMICLLLLNAMWMAMMIGVLVNKVKSGKLKDGRSSSSSSSSPPPSSSSDPMSDEQTEDEF